MIYQLPTVGEVGKIEDVVMDENHRGQGLGKKLLLELIGIADKNKLKKLQLTSSPRRIAAGTLYQSLGFAMKDTDIFIMDLSKE